MFVRLCCISDAILETKKAEQFRQYAGDELHRYKLDHGKAVRSRGNVQDLLSTSSGKFEYQ